MNIKTIAFALLMFLLSCNTTDKKDSTSVNTENSTGDVEAQKKALNDQSKACIAAMNSFEEEKNAALASGDNERATALQASIDSAARENVLIGQKLMALEK